MVNNWDAQNIVGTHQTKDTLGQPFHIQP